MTLKTLHGVDLEQISWQQTQNNSEVYLFTTHEGKPYGTGPFIILDKEHRKLLNPRFDYERIFLHYPEELYQRKVKGELNEKETNDQELSVMSEM